MNDPYATLGLHRQCTPEDIRAAYRELARRWHPDRNAGSAEATARLQEINAAYEVLVDPARRAAHDARSHRAVAGASRARNVKHEVRLRVEDFLRGTMLTVRVSDPANPNGPEIHELEVPEGTAPGSRFPIPRAEPFAGGAVVVTVKLMPGRFKARGSDLRCDLRISAQRAAGGGFEAMSGPAGGMVRVPIPAGVARNAVVRVAGEGLPKPRGGRGDLLVRITYRPEVRAERGARKSGFRRLS